MPKDISKRLDSKLHDWLRFIDSELELISCEPYTENTDKIGASAIAFSPTYEQRILFSLEVDEHSYLVLYANPNSEIEEQVVFVRDEDLDRFFIEGDGGYRFDDYFDTDCLVNAWELLQDKINAHF